MKTINGTDYHERTPQTVIDILENSRQTKQRLILDYGHTEGEKIGHSWGEVNDISGHVGRSTGTSKIPLVIHNSRSMGGPSILDHCIVAIFTAKGKRQLYAHPQYKPFAQ